MFAQLLRRALRLFFHLLYHRMAWTYDAVAWLVSGGQWKAWGQTALPHLRGERILELAHGPGHLLVAMRQRGLRPIGLDLSPDMGRLAHRRLIQAGLPAPLARARAQALPFRDGAFDSAVSTFPTEFIVDPATWQETVRVLNAQGRLVVAPGILFNERGKRNLLYRILAWLYTITGQREAPPPQAWAAAVEAGFSLSRMQLPMGAVDILMIVAEKVHSG
jgi:ubiquinone/menaquinone biosynthesis C-methylase UbiE